MGFCILLKDITTCSWGSRGFKPGTFRLLDDPLSHLKIHVTLIKSSGSKVNLQSLELFSDKVESGVGPALAQVVHWMRFMDPFSKCSTQPLM